MSITVDARSHASTPPRYARFGRRLRGIFIDWVITLAVIVAALLLATSVRSDSFSRVLGLAVVAVLLLYEPLLVWRFGGTVGHFLSNLRVVDDRSGGNVSFPKAVARLLIKGALGRYSFLMITATRRNQALHDVVTRSTVQIREASKAASHHYISERPALDATRMPSGWRRLLVIVLYGVLIAVVEILLVAIVTVSGLLSSACLDRNVCAAGEALGSLLLNAMLLLSLPAMAIVIGLGWRGRLVGARRKTSLSQPGGLK
ncbi:hypothetical protein BH11PSE4_BH11PSE4_35760 [soil metagenome]